MGCEAPTPNNSSYNTKILSTLKTGHDTVNNTVYAKYSKQYQNFPQYTETYQNAEVTATPTDVAGVRFLLLDGGGWTFQRRCGVDVAVPV